MASNDTAVTTAQAESPSDFTGKTGEVERWIAEVQYANKAANEWWKRGKDILARYQDSRGEGIKQLADTERGFNMLWSNVQTLGPAIYSEVPKVVVQRKYLDGDKVARAASTILQRAIQTNIAETDEFAETIEHCRFDYLTVGRGTAWLRYEPHSKTTKQPGEAPAKSLQGNKDPNDEGLSVVNDGQEEYQEITWEEVCVDYVHYKDFIHSPCRVWGECRWVGRKVYMTRDELRKRFKGGWVEDIPLDYSPAMDGTENDAETASLFKRAVVVEVWDRPSRKVLWLAPSYSDRLLDERDDPLGLKDFFPCPKPIFATLTNDSTIPIPDYALYQDQAGLVDDLTNRIGKLSEAIKVAGCYDESCSELNRLLSEGCENELIPVKNWGAFTAGGGFQGSVSFLPLKETVEALAQLVEIRNQTKQDAYEVTGMSDILRGASNPEETATAQNIKSHFATLRLSDRQKAMANFCRDILRLCGEIICKHFQPETLLMMSDYMQSQDADHSIGQAAVQMLRSDAQRGFRVDIETDSTVASDVQQEQQSRVEFLQALGGFLQQSLPIIQSYPPIAPLLGKMILFGVRGFPVGSELETALEEAVNNLEQQAAQGQHPQDQNPQGGGATQQGPAQPGTPEHAAASGVAQQEAAKAQQAQAQAQGAQLDNVAKQALTQAQLADYQSKTRDRDARLQMEGEAHQARLAAMGNDAMLKQREAQVNEGIRQNESEAHIAASAAKAEAASKPRAAQ